MGYAAIGGRLLGSITGDRVSEPVTFKLNGIAQSTTAYGLDSVGNPIRLGVQNSFSTPFKPCECWGFRFLFGMQMLGGQDGGRLGCLPVMVGVRTVSGS